MKVNIKEESAVGSVAEVVEIIENFASSSETIEITVSTVDRYNEDDPQSPLKEYRVGIAWTEERE